MTVAILTGEDIPLQKDNTNDRSPDEHTIVTEVLPSTAPVQPGLRTIFPILELEDHPIDQTKQIKVVVVGAGIAGITAGILLPRKVPNIDLTILDRHDDIGGVWHANVYPGVRCDLPSDVYQSTFAPSMSWKDNYAEGADIKAYWKELVERFDVQKHLKLSTTVMRTEWFEEKGIWVIETERGSKKERLEANILITATGLFSSPKLPEYPGIDEYEGVLRHTSSWDTSFDPTGKRIAVIGNGASGLQVVPALQRVAKTLHHYARSRTWIAGSFGGEELDRDNRVAPSQDPEEYIKYRKALEKNFFSTFGNSIKDGARNAASKEKFQDLMSARLGDRKDLLEAIMPDFPPGCRRLTPGPGYLEALQEHNVQYITTKINSFTRKGLKLVDGTEHEYDAIICGTGGNITYTPVFPIICRGINLQDLWQTGGNPGFPDTYLGMATPNFPNLFFLLGPNSAGLGGTVPNVVENQVTYLAKIIRKVATQGIHSIVPSRAATDDFRAYCESFFPRTVLSGNCSSWYNSGRAGGRITAMWPGSGTHANIVRREVRFEDFEYTYRTPLSTGPINRFAWLGNGFSVREVGNDADDLLPMVDFTPYLKKESVLGTIDLRDLHEAWYEL